MNILLNKYSSTQELALQTLRSQTSEFFMLYGQRLFAFLVFVSYTYLPLHFARVYSEELNWLAENHINGLLGLYFVVKDVVTYSYIAFVLLIYKLEHPFFEQHKINTEAWPWKTDPEGYNVLQKKKMWAAFLGYTVFQLPFTFGGVYLGIIRTSFDFSDLPSYPKLLAQFFFLFFWAEFYFYWMHRLAHTPTFYWVHKKHHEAINTTVLDAQWVSNWEYFGIDIPAFVGGALILGSNCHFLTFVMFTIWQTFSNLDDHSGYEFPWMFTKSLPWCASNIWHNYHHLYNLGNYSAHTILWDIIFGTCKSYADHIDIMEKKKTDKEKITQICAHTLK